MSPETPKEPVTATSQANIRPHRDKTKDRFWGRLICNSYFITDAIENRSL